MATYKVTPSSAAFYAAISGVSTYATTSGVSTTSSYAASAGVSTSATTAGYATSAGVSTISGGLTGSPNITVGIITATSTFVGSAVTIQQTGIRISGVVTAHSFRPSGGYYQSPNGTNAFYVYDGTGNVAFQGTIGASQINNASGNKVIGFAVTDVTFENNVNIAGVSTHTGISTFRATLFGTQLNLIGIATVGLGTTSTPQSNSQMSFELTSNTNLRIKVRGSDGVLRSANITLA